jgi:putative multiple sugar transport system permease protein
VIAAAALILTSLRSRAKQLRHGMENEPRAFFLLKNGIFAVVMVYFSYLLASYRGFPNVLAVMSVLIVAYTFITNRTVLGRRVYAVGGNEGGAPVRHQDGTGQLLHLRQHGHAGRAGRPDLRGTPEHGHAKGGTGFELDVIAACFIGGASPRVVWAR